MNKLGIKFEIKLELPVKTKPEIKPEVKTREKVKVEKSEFTPLQEKVIEVLKNQVNQ